MPAAIVHILAVPIFAQTDCEVQAFREAIRNSGGFPAVGRVRAMTRPEPEPAREILAPEVREIMPAEVTEEALARYAGGEPPRAIAP